MKILLTGASGFLGRHTLPILQLCYGEKNVIPVCSTKYNLMQINQVDQLLTDTSPDVIVHYAAYSGGIRANKVFPADFYYRNTLLTALMFDAAAKHKVKKLIYPMGGCSYPANAKSPIDENQLWNGFPQEESAPYSTAKMMGIVASRSYKTQYDLNSTIIIPGNLYGEYDNFHNLDSHVIPGMIRRYYEAKINNLHEVVMWGTGTPERDFVYASDVAATIPYFIDNDVPNHPINISSNKSTSIRQLATLIADLVGYVGEIRWDTSKPDGQKIKIFDSTRLHKLGLSCPTDLTDGLDRTIKWFINNYNNKTDGIRL